MFGGGGGGGGGFDPRKMQQMMSQFGIDLTEIDAEEVIIRTPEEDLVFDDAEVQKMDAQGQATYQVIGSPESRSRSEDDGTEAAGTSTGGGENFEESDVEIVAQRTGASEDRAREALEATDGDLAAAVDRLE